MFEGLVELGRVLWAFPRIEASRKSEGPVPLIARLRAEGARQSKRSEAQRRLLRRVIERIDAHSPDGGNCFRRALLEIALDPDAAREPLLMGLCASGAPGSGHAWLGSMPDSGRTYDAVIAV